MLRCKNDVIRPGDDFSVGGAARPFAATGAPRLRPNFGGTPHTYCRGSCVASSTAVAHVRPMHELLDDIFGREPLDPTEAARRAMRPQLRRRFYDRAAVENGAG